MSQISIVHQTEFELLTLDAILLFLFLERRFVFSAGAALSAQIDPRERRDYLFKRDI